MLADVNVIFRLSLLAIADSYSAQTQQLSSETLSDLSSVAAAVTAKTPLIDEEKNDIMRAGLLSKVLDHVSLLVEDWFVGVRPRTSVIPCPFCSEDISHDLAQLRRSFSNNPTLLTPEERVERGLPADEDQQPITQVHNTGDCKVSIVLIQRMQAQSRINYD